MYYQLVNGQVVYLSIEEYLSLNDQEFKDLLSRGHGEEPSHNFFYGKQTNEVDIVYLEENPLDIPDEDDYIDFSRIDFDNLE
jgi:hypothetical protein